jgi:hypothetical protein
VAVLENILGYRTHPLDPVPTRDQAVDLLEVDVKDGLVSRPARVSARVARVQSVNEEVKE